MGRVQLWDQLRLETTHLSATPPIAVADISRYARRSSINALRSKGVGSVKCDRRNCPAPGQSFAVPILPQPSSHAFIAAYGSGVCQILLILGLVIEGLDSMICDCGKRVERRGLRLEEGRGGILQSKRQPVVQMVSGRRRTKPYFKTIAFEEESSKLPVLVDVL